MSGDGSESPSSTRSRDRIVGTKKILGRLKNLSAIAKLPVEQVPKSPIMVS
ncbi:hypothetical protein KIN20_013163 [Parelaphostrongylus tenuis]|uniref:Uncharacterized protein n=1 Tax=Parelaphostrongylus tenuis TaxID=148309 RepID=A0AAD5MXS5_PARTN|nr:hypothetical protein KIN20_013163 [Parelaphostrongylus tenuis]